LTKTVRYLARTVDPILYVAVLMPEIVGVIVVCIEATILAFQRRRFDRASLGGVT
jgi:hypothetical protein